MQATIEAAGRSRSAQFDALEALRVEEGVDGLAWEDPGGTDVWSGEPLTPKALPGAPRPWEASFVSGDTTWHAGPFLRALLVQSNGPNGGPTRATVVLRDRGEAPVDTTVERRWATRFRVREERVLPPEALEHPAAPSIRRLPVPSRASGLAPRSRWRWRRPTRPPARLRDRTLRRQGFERLGLGLLALVAATIAIRTRIRKGLRRDLAVGAVLLVARHALVLLEPHRRFRGSSPRSAASTSA
jgi:hypothetical protein